MTSPIHGPHPLQDPATLGSIIKSPASNETAIKEIDVKALNAGRMSVIAKVCMTTMVLSMINPPGLSGSKATLLERVLADRTRLPIGLSVLALGALIIYSVDEQLKVLDQQKKDLLNA